MESKTPGSHEEEQTLSRSSVKSPFQISLAEEEVILNPALVQKIKNDYALEFPAVPENVDKIKVAELLDEFEEKVRSFQDWKILRQLYLGIFSFTKLSMYQELEDHFEVFAEHPIIQSLCGNTNNHNPPEEREVDRVPPENSFQVLDADSSSNKPYWLPKREVVLFCKVLRAQEKVRPSQTLSLNAWLPTKEFCLSAKKWPL